MPSICSNCAKDEVLKEFILRHSSRMARCTLCGTLNAKVLDADTPELRSLIRALVRFHYSEWDYNEHWGGMPIERLLFASNPITNYSASWNQEVYDEIIQDFFDTGYESYDSGISLFTGYDENAISIPLKSLKNSSSPELWTLEQRLRTTNHYLLEPDIDSLLGPHRSRLSASLPVGKVMYRARIGVEKKARPQHGWDEEWHYRPYSGTQLGAPPPHLAGGGRLNRPGVSFLYLATDEDTAICEVRPHPGHCVSVGSFESTRAVAVADFSVVSFRDHFSSDKLLDQYLLLKTIDHLLGLPVVPEDQSTYSLTQFLSDALRRLGFEGVVFRSSVGSGLNVTVFDASSFAYVDGSARSVKVSALQYSYSRMPAMGVKEDYCFDGDGNLLS